MIGFCLGGTLAWAVAGHRRAGVLRQLLRLGRAGDARPARQVECPILFHFGDDDAYIPNEEVERIAEAIAGRAGFVLNVEAAGHAFDNHEAEMF